MKQVWILNHYALGPGEAGGTRHYSLAQGLQNLGWSVSIIAASTNYATGVQRLESKESFRVDRLGGIPFLWLRTPSYQGNGIARMGNMLTYTLRALRRKAVAALAPPDVIVGSSVHPFAAWAGAILARRYGVPFVFEVRDLWPQTLIDMGRISERGLSASLMRGIEAWLCKRASRVIALMPHAADYYVPRGVAAERIVWIPNGVDLNDFRASAPKPRNDVFTLMYFGAHGQANGLDNLLSAIEILKRRNKTDALRVRLVGTGALKASLKEQAVTLGLDCVLFEDPIPKSQIPDLAGQADAFVICVNDLPGLYRFGISMNKLYDYLASARPVVIASSAANNPVNEAGAGKTVPPGNPSALADGILEMMSMPSSERARIGQAGRAYVEANHGFENLARRFAAVLEAAICDYDCRTRN